MRTYFISYNSDAGFGRTTLDSDKLTKENKGDWLKTTEDNIRRDLRKQGIESGRIIILNIQEIK